MLHGRHSEESLLIVTLESSFTETNRAREIVMKPIKHVGKIISCTHGWIQYPGHGGIVGGLNMGEFGVS